MKPKLLLLILSVLLMGFLVTNYSKGEPRNVLLEWNTGTWCIFCPGGYTTANQIQSTYPNSVILAYHGGNDPFANFNGNSVMTLLNFVYYPNGIIDRTNSPVVVGQWMGLVQNRYTSFPNADVGIDVVSVSYYPPTSELKAIINNTAQQNLNGVFKLQYVLTEDGIIYPQNGGSSTFVHDYVVRDMINGATGETITSGIWNQNTSFTDTMTTTLDSSWVMNNCNLNIFVYKDSTGQLNKSTIQQAIDTNIATVTSITNNIGNSIEYNLSQNYPNPFNPTTNIHFSIPKDGNVSLKFYDVLGNEVVTYYDGFLNAGTYNAEFDGSKLSSGVYFYKLSAGDFINVKKMVLLK